LHTGKDHWVTICTTSYKSSEVDIFDSMSPTVTWKPKEQISSLLYM
jgi:hypothetical protein